MPRMIPLRRFLVSSALLAVSSVATAVTTPYDTKPAAFWCTDGMVWDYQVASLLKNVKADIIYLPEGCHSGGMLQEVAAAYGASSCDWDEHALTPAHWGTQFWDALHTGSQYGQAWSAACTSDVLDVQLPRQVAGVGSGWTAGYRAGDRAILFAGSAEARFVNDVRNAEDALKANGWPDAAIGKVEGGTRAQLTAAIEGLGAMQDGQRLILYLRDHGASTDVIRSRRTGTRYEYETQVSIWRPDDFDADPDDTPYIYGITDLYLRGYLLRGYLNWADPMATWDHRVFEDVNGEIWIHWFAEDRNDPDNWLVSGMTYAFGYDHVLPPARSSWQNLRWGGDEGSLGSLGRHDWGNIGGAWGVGAQVYGLPTQPAKDPAQWPGWANGGDGWVLVPVPEPLSALGVFLGVASVAAYVRRRRIAAAAPS